MKTVTEAQNKIGSTLIIEQWNRGIDDLSINGLWNKNMTTTYGHGNRRSDNEIFVYEL